MYYMVVTVKPSIYLKIVKVGKIMGIFSQASELTETPPGSSKPVDINSIVRVSNLEYAFFCRSF